MNSIKKRYCKYGKNFLSCKHAEVGMEDKNYYCGECQLYPSEFEYRTDLQ